MEGYSLAQGSSTTAVAILRSLIEVVSNKRRVNVTTSSGSVLIKRCRGRMFDIVHQCGATASLSPDFLRRRQEPRQPHSSASTRWAPAGGGWGACQPGPL